MSLIGTDFYGTSNGTGNITLKSGDDFSTNIRYDTDLDQTVASPQNRGIINIP